MRIPVLFLFFSVVAGGLHAQTADSLLTLLQTINNRLAALPCNTGTAPLLSNRATNLYWADRVGGYLSDGIDLSYHKNVLVFNSAEGTIAVAHNQYTPTGTDERIATMGSFGIKANVFNAYTAAFNGKQYINELGATLKYTFIGKGGARYPVCTAGAVNAKQEMDTYRALLLHQLQAELTQKVVAFEQSLNKITPAETPGQDTAAAKRLLRRNFYTALAEEYTTKYAAMQAQTLVDATGKLLMTSNWTSIYAYLPVLPQRFTVTGDYHSNFTEKHAWPAQLVLSHSRIWESRTAGRILATVRGSLLLNNSRQASGLLQTGFAAYQFAGGVDTGYFTSHPQYDVYIGAFRNFITPALSAQLVYIPPGWHWGITGALEQNMGTYHALNAKLAIPMLLINIKGSAQATLEFQVRFSDITNTLNAANRIAGKTAVGVTLGVPFERIAY